MQLQTPSEKRQFSQLEEKDQYCANHRKRPMPARDVAPGECWAFTDHRTLAEVMAEAMR